MKKIILFLILFFFAHISYAQNEFYIPWSDDSISSDGASHITDENGNLYILCDLYAFDTLEGSIIPTDPFSNAVIKIDKNNNILWEKLYYNYYTGSQILFLNNSILVPYSLDIGLSLCWQLPGGSIYKESSINAALLINNITGDTVSNTFFYDGKSCGTTYITYSYINNNYLYNVYWDDSFTIGPSAYPANYIEKLDAGFHIITDTLFGPLNTIINNDSNYILTIIYDSFSRNYVIEDGYGIKIYNSFWKLLSEYNLHIFNLSFREIEIIQIACNSNYYAINCSLSIDSFGDYAYYTIICTKDGELISCQPSLLFNDFLLTNDNHIFGVSTNTGDTLIQPVTMVEMDLFQNVRRKVMLGKPGVAATKMSLTNDNNIIISGSYVRIFDNFPQPDEIYYYRQALDEIPILNNDSSICNAIAIFPNPTKNSITISSVDFNTTYKASVELFNIMGQKLDDVVFDTKTLSIDLSAYPAGVYFLKARNNTSSCVEKIVKE